jgi:hypothetical protein
VTLPVACSLVAPSRCCPTKTYQCFNFPQARSHAWFPPSLSFPVPSARQLVQLPNPTQLGKQVEWHMPL